MSYIVHLWERPVPLGLAEALEVHARLARLGGTPHPRLLGFVAGLTARHPDIDTLDDADDSAGVWTDGPLANNVRGPLLSLGVQTHAIDTVVPWVVAEAQAHGLVVLDEQAAQLHLPDGRTLGWRGPVAPAPVAPAPGPAPLTRAAVAQRLHAVVAPGLQAAGFERPRGGDDHVFTAPDLRLRLNIHLESHHDTLEASLHVVVELRGDGPHPMLHALYPRGADNLLQLHTLARETGLTWPEAQEAAGLMTRVPDAAALEALAARWQRLFDGAVLPVLRSCATLEGLAQHADRHPAHFGPAGFSVVLAAAVGRTDLAAAAATCAPFKNDFWRERDARLVALLSTPPTPPLDAAVAPGRASLDGCLPTLRAGGLPLQRAADGQWLPRARQPVVQAVVADLQVLVACVVDGAAATLLQGDATALGVTGDALLEQALANLRRRAAAGLARRAVGPGPVVQLQLDGCFDAALMMLPELWDTQLAAETPNGALVAVPQPGMLLYCDVAAPGGLPTLRQRVADATVDAATRLTPTVFYRRPGAWEALPAPR